nr:2-iminobutanoate/2-iminopropanoate deaminase isoform X2 [Nothobranchius furzeri]
MFTVTEVCWSRVVSCEFSLTREMSAVIRRIISTAKAPAAIGPYSQAVVVDRSVYVSGQLGMDPASGQLVGGGVQAQTRQALVNMGEILRMAGCTYENVFRSNFPARAAYQAAALPRGGLVEIEAVAVLGPLSDSS